jgi:hypothetical protein
MIETVDRMVEARLDWDHFTVYQEAIRFACTARGRALRPRISFVRRGTDRSARRRLNGTCRNS